MHRCLVLFLLAFAVRAQQNNGDLESVIKQIFGDLPNPNAGTNNLGNFTPGSDNKNNEPTPTNQAGPVTPEPDFNLSPGGGATTSGNKDTSCLTENSERGECVQYYLCNSNNSIITDGVGIIDIRVRDGPCESYLDTCCLQPDRIQQPITPSPEKLNEERQGCGWHNPEGVGFRIKGDSDNEAKFGEFPWMVAILKVELVNDQDPEGQKLNVYVGGGSLIHSNVVLTAAHYVASAGALRVRAGEWDTQTKNEIYPFQDRDVQLVKVHKDYDRSTLFYDIALLFLTEPMEMAPNVGLVCLPPPRIRAPAGVRCFASGWGKDQFGKEGRYQVILKKVEVPVVDRNTCTQRLRKTRLGRFFELHTSFMCAGGEPGKDTCKGDGGSPLVCPVEFEKDRYQQNGIVAWGIGCGEDGTPGVYVDVANLRDWIDDAVAGRGYDPSIYTA